MANLSQSVAMDRKGRLLIPKKLRDAAAITPPATVLARVAGPGRIELVEVDPQMRRAREIGRKKLAGWREEEHEAESLGLRLVSPENK